jgi:hypothetical protein
LALTARLTRGQKQSCGCLNKVRTAAANTTHGYYGTKEYFIWKTIIQRCYDPNHKEYHLYGGRGITVCDRWRYWFPNFLEDVGSRPENVRNCCLMLIDKDRNYEPGNCLWARASEVQNNRRNNRFIEIKGQRLTRAEAARIFKIDYFVLRHRLNAGWPVEAAIFTPVGALSIRPVGVSKKDRLTRIR